MKKYFQITTVIGLFTALVIFRNIRGSENPVVGNQLTPSSSTPTQQITNTQTTGSSAVMYKDGTYTGSIGDASYGNIQVQAVIVNGKLTDVVFLQYPNDNQTSISINTQAMPLLKSEAIQAQSASVDIISGASDSSQAFQQSLGTALSQATK